MGLCIYGCLLARAQAALHEEGLNVCAIICAAASAARVLAAPVKDHAVRAADPVVAVVAVGLGLQRVRDKLGRVLVVQARLFGLLLVQKRNAALLNKVGTREGRIHFERKQPARNIPDAAERLELVLDGEGLAGHNELRLIRVEVEREHLVGD